MLCGRIFPFVSRCWCFAMRELDGIEYFGFLFSWCGWCSLVCSSWFRELGFEYFVLSPIPKIRVLRAIFCCFGSFSVAPCVYSYVIEFFGLFISQRGWCSLDCWCLEFGCEYFFSVSCSEDSLACVQFFVVLVVSVFCHARGVFCGGGVGSEIGPPFFFPTISYYVPLSIFFDQKWMQWSTFLCLVFN